MPNYNLPASSEFFKGDIYTRMTEDLHLAGFSQRTVHGYLRSMRQLADFCRCSPDQVNEQQVRQWLLHLKLEKEFAYGSLRVAFSGIKFFFTRTCKRNWDVLSKTKLQNVKSLPEVLTPPASQADHRCVYHPTHGDLLLDRLFTRPATGRSP